MPRQLDPAIQEVLKKYHPEPKRAVWDCHGTWVVYHKDVELMAAKAGIVFDPPQVIEANGQGKCAAICVTAHLGTRSDWSIGEAAPGNNKNAYPFAMAEKRARDRVAIKLLGLHGVYSDEEADDFKQQAAAPAPEPQQPAPLTPEQSATVRDTMIFALEKCDSHAEILAWREEQMTNFQCLTKEDKQIVAKAK